MADKLQILIVEDDHDLADMLTAYLDVQGYTVLTASQGEQALTLAARHDPDLVILDIHLPDIDGYEVCRRLRSHHPTQDTPIIFLTEKRDRVDRLQGLELGVVDYITKPFDIQELRLRIRNTLRRAAQRPSLNRVTGLPEGAVVDEQLAALLPQRGWGVLCITLGGLEDFRERYGFVTADDALRAVSLMVRNAVQEGGAETDFVGHLGPSDLVIVVDAGRLAGLRTRIEARLLETLPYFYPLAERQQTSLTLQSGVLPPGAGPFADVAALKKAILLARRPLSRPPQSR
ncbi:MAG: response regulator [Anaerolineae bacterium]|nr:response regulator [Anaerolineae bacterium]